MIKNLVEMRNAFTLLLLTLFFYSKTLSQNLIPNPSFEDVNICIKYSEPCAPKAWRSTVLKNFYYFEYLAIQGKSIPPPDGARSVAFTMYLEGKGYERKFIQAPLICPLKKGESYRLSFQYLVKDCTVGTFGAFFTDSLAIYKNNEPMKEVQPQVLFEVPENIEAGKWMEASATFTAAGDEKGVVLGNFSSDEATRILPAKGVKNKAFEQCKKRRIYIRFDQMILEALDTEAHEDCPFEQNLQVIYEDSVKHSFEEIVQAPDWEETILKEEESHTTLSEKSIIIAEDTIRANEVFVFSNINFEHNSTQLLASSYRPLEQIMEALRTNPEFNLEITGHTDNVGSQKANQWLSEKRAEAVATFLINNGIRKNRLTVSGKGESEPIAENDSEEGRFLNRRVAFIFVERDVK